MKILDITPITDASEFPVKKGTLQFLQDAYKESVAAALQGLVGPGYDPTVVYVLYGVTNSGTYPVYNIAAGAVFYAGEVFMVDAAAFTATGSNVGVFQIVTTQYTVDADPVTFTDTTVRNVHNIRKIQVVQGLTGSSPLPDYSQAFFMNFVIPLQLNLTAPSSGAFTGNLLQLIGAYPNIELFVPPSLNPNPILAAGTLNVGDVGGGGADFTVTIPGGPLSTAAYYVAGTFISNGSSVRVDSVVQFSIRNRTTTTFQVHFEEFSAGVQNIAWEYILFKK
jgi:hypothetical protein